MSAKFCLQKQSQPSWSLKTGGPPITAIPGLLLIWGSSIFRQKLLSWDNCLKFNVVVSLRAVLKLTNVLQKKRHFTERIRYQLAQYYDTMLESIQSYRYRNEWAESYRNTSLYSFLFSQNYINVDRLLRFMRIHRYEG